MPDEPSDTSPSIDDTDEFDADAAAPEPESDDIETLHQTIAQLRSELEAAQNDFKRARADFQNLKRRTEEEREQLRYFLVEELVKKLLPVLDNFERALVAASQTSDYERLIGGIQAIYKQFGELLVAEGLTTIPGSTGTPFDPNLHNAVLRDEESDLPDNVIVEELQRGYLLGGKVLRPTLVKVATGG